MDKFFVNGGCATNKQLFTGVGKCDVLEGVSDYLIITRPNAEFAIPEDGDFTSALKTAINKPYNDEGKAWIVGKITTNNAPEGGDNISNTKGTRGGSVVTGQNPISIAYAFPGGVCMYNQLSRLKGMEVRVLRVDRSKNVFGTYDTDDNKLKGFSASLWITETPEADGGDVEMVTVTVSYGVDYFKELEQRSNLTLKEIPDALRPVAIVAGETTKTFAVKYTCSGEDVDAATATLLAEPANFVGDTGDTISAVTYDSATKLFTATGATKIKLATPDVLATAGVFGVEGFDELVTLN